MVGPNSQKTLPSVTACVAIPSQKAAEGASSASTNAQHVGKMSGEVAQKMTVKKAKILN